MDNKKYIKVFNSYLKAIKNPLVIPTVFETYQFTERVRVPSSDNNDCYMNSLDYYRNNSNSKLIIGICMTPELVGITYHAWNLDPQGRLVDTTIPMDYPIIHIGLDISSEITESSSRSDIYDLLLRYLNPLNQKSI